MDTLLSEILAFKLFRAEFAGRIKCQRSQQNRIYAFTPISTFFRTLSDSYGISLPFSHFQPRPRDCGIESFPDGHPACNRIYPDGSCPAEIRTDKTACPVRQLLGSFIKAGKMDIVICDGITLALRNLNIRGRTA